MTATTMPTYPPIVPVASSSVRRVAAGAAIGAVVARVASIFLWPPDSDASHAKMLATAGAHPTAWNLATWAEVICWVTAGFAVLVASGLASGRGARVSRIGGWVYGASLVTLGLVGGSQNAVTGVLARQAHPERMVNVVDDLHSAGALQPFVLLILLGELFVIVLAVGLARAGLVGWWFVGLSVLALAGYVATSSSSNHLVVLVGFVPLGTSWLLLARLLLAHAPLAGRAPLADPALAGADRGGARRST